MLTHRGPDDHGMEILPLQSQPGYCIGLAARRLAILDLSPAGHQPMYDPRSDCWIVFNGEIFNFREIRAELEKLGYSFNSRGDTEVLLKAYGQWGGACVDRLRGMFAFAVWDVKKERLLLARDQLGVKPLYYCTVQGGLGFSSEVRALIGSGLVPRRVDPRGLASYLAFGAVQDRLTMVEGVYALPPGHALVWQNGSCQDWAYWSLSEVACRDPVTDSRAEAIDIVHRILVETISLHLASDVPLGVFLSGGVDSSSILALAAETHKEPLATFSVVFPQREYSEVEHSDLVAQTFGSRHLKLEVREEQLLQSWPDALVSMDQPSIDGINTYMVSLACKRAGITVALSGLGGDEIFAGYSSFRSVPRMMRVQPYLRWMRPLWETTETHLGPPDANRLAKLWALATENYPGSHPYFLSRALFLPSVIRTLLPQKPRQEFCDSGIGGIPDFTESIRHLDPVNQVSVLEGSTYMPNMLLRDTDCMSMAHSLEVRVPFADHRLWEHVLPLSGRLKLDSRMPKPLLVEAVRPRLPEKICLRRKMGFTLPFKEWLQGPLRNVIEHELCDAWDDFPWPLDPSVVSAVWDSFLRGKTNWSRPWSLFVLKQWIRRNIWGSS